MEEEEEEVEEVEVAMMQAMVEVDEDKRPDDGEVEIPSKDEYHWHNIVSFHPRILCILSLDRTLASINSFLLSIYYL